MRACICSHVKFYGEPGAYFCRPGFARLLEAMAPLWDELGVCVPVAADTIPPALHRLSIPNIRVLSLPEYYHSTAAEILALARARALTHVMAEHLRPYDVVCLNMPCFISVVAWKACVQLRKRTILRIGADWPEMLRLACRQRHLVPLGPVASLLARRTLRKMVQYSELTLVTGEALAVNLSRYSPNVVPFVASTIREAEICTSVATSKSDIPVILYVGRMDFKKGLRELVRAIGLLRDRGVRCRFPLCQNE